MTIRYREQILDKWLEAEANGMRQTDFCEKNGVVSRRTLVRLLRAEGLGRAPNCLPRSNKSCNPARKSFQKIGEESGFSDLFKQPDASEEVWVKHKKAPKRATEVVWVTKPNPKTVRFVPIGACSGPKISEFAKPEKPASTPIELDELPKLPKLPNIPIELPTPDDSTLESDDYQMIPEDLSEPAKIETPEPAMLAEVIETKEECEPKPEPEDDWFCSRRKR